MYWLRKRLWSQNFLSNRELISKLIRDSSIISSDTVLEIGSGKGIITKELLKVTPHVIAVEKDPRFTKNPQDFLTYLLPTNPYKVFANIPFSITGDIIRKLLQASNPPADCYLIVQSEAANKFIINSTDTMAALLYYPWWNIQITHNFNRNDFHPIPKIDSVLLHIKPKLKPLIPIWQKTSYYDFIAHSYVHNSQAKFIRPSLWLTLFRRDNHTATSGAYAKLLKERGRLQKIHRTRLDTNWKKFK